MPCIQLMNNRNNCFEKRYAILNIKNFDLSDFFLKTFFEFTIFSWFIISHHTIWQKSLLTWAYIVSTLFESFVKWNVFAWRRRLSNQILKSSLHWNDCDMHREKNTHTLTTMYDWVNKFHFKWISKCYECVSFTRPFWEWHE